MAFALASLGSLSIDVLRNRPLAPRAGGEVFAINFARRALVPVRIQWFVAAAAVLSLSLNVLVLLGLVVNETMAEKALGEVTARLGESGLSSVTVLEMQELHQRASYDLATLKIATGMAEQQLPAADKLAALSRTLPARTWITKIAGDWAERRITVSARFLVDAENPYELPSKAWIDALRADAGFSQGLRRSELTSSSRQGLGKADVFAFDLVAEWSPR